MALAYLVAVLQMALAFLIDLVVLESFQQRAVLKLPDQFLLVGFG